MNKNNGFGSLVGGLCTLQGAHIVTTSTSGIGKAAGIAQVALGSVAVLSNILGDGPETLPSKEQESLVQPDTYVADSQLQGKVIESQAMQHSAAR